MEEGQARLRAVGVIALRSVTKRFGDRTALDGVSIDVRPATTHLLMGLSQSGKSTVLQLISGLFAPDAGEVQVDGTRVTPSTRAELGSRMGYVAQDVRNGFYPVYPDLTAYQNVTLPTEARGWEASRARARVAELGTMMGLDEESLRRSLRELSCGQYQRLEVMRALVLDPPVLLLDEPLGALHPIVRAEPLDQLSRLFLGKTVVLATHDLSEAARLDATITLLHAGRVVQQGTYNDLLMRPATPFVTEFLTGQALRPCTLCGFVRGTCRGLALSCPG